MASRPTTADETGERDQRRQRRGVIARYGLAGAALLGIGAAATVALWTDDAWFRAEATTVDPDVAIMLQGAVCDAGGTAPSVEAFQDADTDTDGVRVEVPAETFADLVAGDSITVPLCIRNGGTHTLQIAEPVVTTDPAADSLFAPGGATATLDPSEVASTLAPGEVDAVDLTVALAADADRSFGGRTGTVTVQFQGSIANRG